MNYYPFHIGDFAAHTSHLSWEEDIAYRRMLDWYYLNEKALPLDKQKLARLIRMPNSLAAIETILDEFFSESGDGWHNKRADQELTSMLAKQEQQATKDEHEADRMKRYRERRAEIFAALRAVQIVPAWDVPMKELQRLHDTHCNAPETRTGTLPETDSQRLSLPTPTPTPTPTPSKEEKRRASASATPPKPDGVDEQVWTDWLTARKAQKAAVTQTVIAGNQREAGRAGISLNDALAACCEYGWRSFNAEWYAGRKAKTQSGAKPTESFFERDQRAKREQWEQMTGRKWPTEKAHETIDITPKPLEIEE